MITDRSKAVEKTPFSKPMRSLTAAALSSRSRSRTKPRSRAFCRISSSPVVPSFNRLVSLTPSRPNAAAASAARSLALDVSDSFCRYRSSAASVDRADVSCARNPLSVSRKSVTRVPVPARASPMVRVNFCTALSNASAPTPDSCDATRYSCRASVPNAMLSAAFCTASAVSSEPLAKVAN